MALKSKQPEINPGILAAAAEWFAVLASGSVTPDQRQQWQAWLASHPDHQSAWARVEFFAAKFDGLPAQAASSALNAANLARRRALKTLVVFGVLSWSGFELRRSGLWQEWSADYGTGTQVSEFFTLADGSRIKLDAASAVNVDFSADLRRIQLFSGEIYIETAADNTGRHRPFVVDSVEGRCRALGTRFSVRQLDGESHAAVFDGAVEITPAEPSSTAPILNTGQETLFTRYNIDQIQKLDARQPAWTEGILLADNLPLGEFILQLSRYRHGFITCSSDAADLRIVGAFPLTDTDRILAELAKTLPVKMVKISPWWIRIERQG